MSDVDDEAAPLEEGPEAPATPSEPAPRKRSRWVRVAAVTGSLAVGLLLAEVVVRIAAPQRLTVPTQEATWGLIVPRAGVRGHDTSPGEFEVRITTNAQRFRGERPTAPTASAGTLRIAVLGDSFTFGEGARDDETIPARLEQLLTASGSAVEVLNAGNRGSGTGTQALYYDEHVRTFGPRVVVLVAYANDVQDDLSRGLFRLKGGVATPRPRAEREAADADLRSVRSLRDWIPGYVWLTQRSHLTNLLRRLGTGVLTGRRTEAEGNVAAVDPERRFREVGLPLLRGELNWLEAKVRAEGARLAVVFLPAREVARGKADEATRARAAAHVDTLRAACSVRKAPFLDLSKALTERPALYYDWDPHLRPAGYAFVAERIAELLRTSGLVQRP